jgi:RNA polymerase sigma-70 factor (ECF subfamily)
MDRTESTALLRDAREGSAGALERLYALVGPRLLALVRLRLGPSLRARLESRDILQATLLKSFQRFHQFEGADGTSLMAWLARIAEHEIRDRADYHHRQRRDPGHEIPLDGVEPMLATGARSALTQVVLDEEAQRLERAIEMLAPDYREVILLRKFEERSFGEIADRLQRSEDACRMLLARAMAALTLVLHEDR